MKYLSFFTFCLYSSGNISCFKPNFFSGISYYYLWCLKSHQLVCKVGIKFVFWYGGTNQKVVFCFIRFRDTSSGIHPQLDLMLSIWLCMISGYAITLSNTDIIKTHSVFCIQPYNFSNPERHCKYLHYSFVCNSWFFNILAPTTFFIHLLWGSFLFIDNGTEIAVRLFVVDLNWVTTKT